jgi:hypothetical protein
MSSSKGCKEEDILKSCYLQMIFIYVEIRISHGGFIMSNARGSKRAKARRSRSYPVGCSVPKAAKVLGVTDYIVRSLIRLGEIKANRIGKQDIVPHSEIERLRETFRITTA